MYLLKQSFVSPRVLKMLVVAGEITLVSLLAVQAARLVWIAVTPPPSIGILSQSPSSLRSDLSILSSFNPFAARGGARTTDADGALTLFGVRVAGADSGTAIIGARGAVQGVYAVGDEVAPEIRLKNIFSDHVVLERAGRETRLSLVRVPGIIGAPVISSPLIPTPADFNDVPASIRAEIDPEKFLGEAGLMPRLTDGQITGYTLLPRAGGETLKRAGLEAGDVIVALNGSRLTPERYSSLAEEFTAGREIQLTVERGAATRTITLQTGGQQ